MGKSKFAVNALLVSVFLGTLVFPTAQAAGAGETHDEDGKHHVKRHPGALG